MPNIQTRKYYLEKYDKDDDWRLSDREFFELVQRFNKFANKDEKLSLDEYRAMMGVLGNTYLTERMFVAMDKDNDEVIDLSEYLTYNDIISHGTVEEKRDQNFRMFNLNRDTQVTYDEFEDFSIKILDMYSRTVSEKIKTNRKQIKEIFDKIARPGNDFFTFEDYKNSLDNDAGLFIWLERPKEMLHEILNEEEGEYSKQFVDETLELFFTFIANVEVAMVDCIKYCSKLRRQRDGNDDEDDNDVTINADNIRPIIDQSANIILDINANPDKINIKDHFTKNKSYAETLRVLTKQLNKVRNSFEINYDDDQAKSAVDFEDEGGSSEEDEEELDEENEGEEDEDDDEDEDADEDDEERKSAVDRDSDADESERLTKPQISVSDEFGTEKRNVSHRFSMKLKQHLSGRDEDVLTKLEEL